jgi:integrase
MARSYFMSWDGPRGRWVKMYKGQRFTVACSVLGVPPTKDQSYQAANRWWEAKKAEIDSANRPAPLPMTPLEQTALAVFKPPEEWEDVIQTFRERGIDNEQGLAVPLWHLFNHHLAAGRPLPERMIQNLPPARIQQLEDAGKAIRGEPTAAADKTLAAHAEAWMRSQAALVDAGQMTAARVANNRTCLEHFKTFLGPQSAVAAIDGPKLEAFYLYVAGKIRRNGNDGWSVAYAKDVFSVARSFIRWAWEQGACELPRNIDAKFKFGSPARAVTTWTAEEFKRAVEAAPGKLKLALLLMANTGATQQDISDLLDAEVDWAAGRVIRKRSKTADRENVPVVNYKLWPATFELLQKYRSGQERVLLTESGEPYVRTRLNDQGKLVKADGFASNFVHLKKRLKLDRPLKELRKLGASLLGSHKDYGRLASYFLGHSPRTVADRHYVTPPQELFDEAVTWLGKQLGQVPE